ncbi:TPA: tetratricopeptide repeat protein [Candidatus Bipolaricaulota bacterium]|nr:tetratricopeptide repeat protein [Candidatus Bipolaricaulota bacterium]
MSSEGEALQEVEKALEEAERLRRAGRYDEGISLLVEALRYGEEKAKIYFRLGNIYFDAGDLERAEYAYKRAIEHDPEHLNAHHNLAVVYRRQGRIGEYVKQQKRALRLAARRPPPPLSEEEARRARRMAFVLFLFGLGLLALLALALFLIGLGRG